MQTDVWARLRNLFGPCLFCHAGAAQSAEVVLGSEQGGMGLAGCGQRGIRGHVSGGGGQSFMTSAAIGRDGGAAGRCSLHREGGGGGGRWEQNGKCHAVPRVHRPHLAAAADGMPHSRALPAQRLPMSGSCAAAVRGLAGAARERR